MSVITPPARNETHDQALAVEAASAGFRDQFKGLAKALQDRTTVPSRAWHFSRRGQVYDMQILDHDGMVPTKIRLVSGGRTIIANLIQDSRGVPVALVADGISRSGAHVSVRFDLAKLALSANRDDLPSQMAQGGGSCFWSAVEFVADVGLDFSAAAALIAEPEMAIVSPNGTFWGGVALIGATAAAYNNMAEDCGWT